MRRLCFKFCACLLAVLMAFSAAACDFISKDSDTDSDSSVVQTQDTPAVQTDTEQEVPDTDIGEHKDYTEEDAEGFMSGVLIVNQDGHYRAMDMFVGSSAEYYITQLNYIKDSVDYRVNVYSMVVPTACEFYCPKNFQENITSQHDVILEIGEGLVNVKNIDPWETLTNHNAENIFSRTDHHWQALGAYYACKVFAKQAGVEYPDISSYQRVDMENYVGSMTAFAYYDGAAALESDPETFTYYKPTNKYTTAYYGQDFEFITNGELITQNDYEPYMSFIQGDSYCARITTDVKNGRKLLMVKDSFGNAAVPFLTSSFEEIVVVDMRYLEVNLLYLVDELEITDLLFLMNTFSAVGTNADNLETLCTNPNVGEIEDISSILEESSEENSEESSEESSDLEGIDTENREYYGSEYYSEENPYVDESAAYVESGDVTDYNNGGDDYYNDYYGDDSYGDDTYYYE